MTLSQWEIVIGLEIHAQLATRTKIFSASSTAYGAEPNTQANLIDLGMPGVLPCLNKEAVDMAVTFGLAIGAEIGMQSVFARKNYFYPDLPKGYQISQFELPIVGRGNIDIDVNDTTKTIGITRAHLEEDAGKSLHENFVGMSGIDLNRAGTPLLEIVSEPDIRSIDEAVAYAKKIHMLVQYLEICDGNMQEGSFRCDANISLRPQGRAAFGTRAEIKNLNSFRFLEKALAYEIGRQADILESGAEVVQETRLYDSDNNKTFSMRSKEEANDYRYFPDPDLLPVIVTDDMLEQIRQNLPELPQQKQQRFKEEFALSRYDVGVLTADKPVADYFEDLLTQLDGGKTHAKLASNWVTGNLAGALNAENLRIEESPVNATQLAALLSKITDKSISGNIAKQVFEAMWAGEGSADDIIKAKGLSQITDTKLIADIIDEVIANNPEQLAAYQGGKDKLFGFFVGQVMKQTKGQADPAEVNKALKEKLQG